ncbi:MAG: tetraacyldisaccharide 4'-kinase [Rhodobacteraceae bacterium]|nr:tetraacyldisaccharide 4'-kinase [Paracoccaceae bacterium]
MKPPAFWFSDPAQPGLAARILSPLSRICKAATAARVARPADFRPGIPVICVGNLTVGGAGKTPTVVALAQRLSARGHAAHILSRGYGGTLAGPVQVSERHHQASDTGDEPLLMAGFAPVWVARDRAAGARAAVAAGAGVLLLDDGFQNPSVAKDLSIVVADAATGFGNGLCLPAGPLREPVEAGLARADMVLTLGAPGEQATFLSRWGGALNVPHVAGRLAPLETGMDWAGLPVLAFAGIGRPEKFFATLRGLGAEVVRTVALDDHQPLSPGLLRRLGAEAGALGAQLVTTEKDAVRLPDELRSQVLTLPVRLEIDDWALLDAALGRIGL